VVRRMSGAGWIREKRTGDERESGLDKELAWQVPWTRTCHQFAVAALRQFCSDPLLVKNAAQSQPYVMRMR
jgi:hypothetical protein